jgi:hypothetical protein
MCSKVIEEGLSKDHVARLGGFEPPAKSLEGSCSIRLSYRRVIGFSELSQTYIYK